jgi:hypothetical protein
MPDGKTIDFIIIHESGTPLKYPKDKIYTFYRVDPLEILLSDPDGLGRRHFIYPKFFAPAGSIVQDEIEWFLTRSQIQYPSSRMHSGLQGTEYGRLWQAYYVWSNRPHNIVFPRFHLTQEILAWVDRMTASYDRKPDMSQDAIKEELKKKLSFPVVAFEPPVGYIETKMDGNFYILDPSTGFMENLIKIESSSEYPNLILVCLTKYLIRPIVTRLYDFSRRCARLYY